VTGRRGRWLTVVASCGFALALAGVAVAQDPGFRGRGFRFAVRMATPESFDGGFNFCRVMYQSTRSGFGGGWATDYPSADRHLSIRLSELTRTRVSVGADGEPNYLVVRLTDNELFQCPFVLMAEVGRLYIDDEEAPRLREYLLKGGFLWVDDFWGSYAWENWAGEIAKVLPPAEYPIVDIPNNHPLYRTMFELGGMPQIPSINYWFGSGGDTSEQGPDSAEVHARLIADSQGRPMVLMTHNTDISDSWEREADNRDYFYRFSVDGYAVGINVMLYAMTH
jgi:hypothetical protein